MSITLNHSRTSIEYVLDLEISSFLIVEDYDPATKTAQVVRISRMLHRDMHEPVPFGSPKWRTVISAFHAQKQLLVQRIHQTRQAPKAEAPQEMAAPNRVAVLATA